MRTALIIQARMGSSRLPGKVLKDLCGKPMLEWVVERGSRAKGIDVTLVATTVDPSDDPIEAWCRDHGTTFFRGSVFDVLDRFYQAALSCGADRVVRVTADCPLIDGQTIDDVIALFDREGADFAANRLPPPWHRTFPIGLDVEMTSFAMLERAWREGAEPFEREHVMPWFYATPGRCKVSILDHVPDYGAHRWTVDTPDDYILLNEIFARLSDPLNAPWQEVLTIVERNPELEMINQTTRAKKVDAVDERALKNL